MLRVDPRLVRFLYLKGSYEVIRERLERRTGHYMRPELLQSQFEALEEPEDEWVEDIGLRPEEVIEHVMKLIAGTGRRGIGSRDS